jgi:hypothetical protein
VAAGVASGAVCGVIDTLDQLDTSAFYERSLLGGVGRADPDMLLTLLVYGVPPSFRTADRLGSIPERRGIRGSKTAKVFAGVSWRSGENGG